MLGAFVLLVQQGLGSQIWPFRILSADSLNGHGLGPSLNGYKPGQSVDFAAQVDVLGVLTDAPALSLTVHSQYGTSPDITGAVIRDSLGLYHATVGIPATALPGVWVARWQIPGSALAERRFVVQALGF